MRRWKRIGEKKAMYDAVVVGALVVEEKANV